MTDTTSLIGRLSDPSLLRDRCPVGGLWRADASSGRRLQVHNPATGALLADLPDFSVAEVRQAIDAAHAAHREWSAQAAKVRAAALRRLYDLIIANVEDLATIITAEMGKPLAEARAEVRYGAGYIEWYGEEAKRLAGETLPAPDTDRRIIVIRQPVGVVAAIAPWNFPFAMVARKMAPAVSVGCAMVFKPAPETPLSALALATLAERAGIPGALFSVVPTSDASSFGTEVCNNDKVRKLTFTGSTGVGRLLMAQASQKVLRLSLELGGNAPFIVFDDADLDAAVEGAMQSKYRNAGQTCVCANRLYVQAGIYDAFVDRLARRVGELEVGDGFAPGVSIGPLINEKATAKFHDHIEDAVAKGGTVVVGGGAHALGGTFVQPTLIANATPAMKVAREETFAPLAPVFRFDTAEEAVRLANDTEFGLAAYFFARDLRQVWRVAEALEYGMVGVNTGLISTEVAPFGGVKQSGFGREGSRHGLDDYVSMKYICLAGL
ncbi:MAG: NAD-dependent succinate-semialdehyde dehydrogenase [Rhizobiaceae bacterium]|nr:NAD-dependent succinate-semialdehyde dehydrogenase [Rhizobiaceae bacterium]